MTVKNSATMEAYVGIHCFAVPTASMLCTRIKSNPEDFVVVELTATYAAVETIPDGLPMLLPPLPLQVQCSADTSTARAPCFDDDTGKKSIEEAVDVLEPSTGKKSIEEAVNVLEPNEVLPDVHEGLSRVLGQGPANRLWGWIRSHPGKEILCAPSHELELEAPPDKQLRARLHLAILSILPALCTSVDRERTGCISVRARPLAELLGLLGPQQTHRLCYFAAIKPELPEDQHTLAIPLPRAERTTLHQILRREAWLKHLQAETMREGAGGAVGGTAGVMLRWKPTRKRKAGAEERSRVPSYLHFVCEKVNVESGQAVRQLAHAFGVPPSAVGYAGTKDAVARTRQRMSVALDAAQLGGDGGEVGISTMARLEELPARGIQIGLMTFAPDPIRLGELGGNQFQIVLRSIRLALPAAQQLPPAAQQPQLGPPATSALALAMDAGVERLMRIGFVNYYGLQRFGWSASVEVGRLVLRGEYEGAVDTLLGEPRSAEPCEVGAVRQQWRSLRTSNMEVATRVRLTLRAASAVPHASDRLADELAILRGCPSPLAPHPSPLAPHPSTSPLNLHPSSSPIT